MRLGQVLAGRALALVQIRNGVEPQPVDAESEPEVEDLEDRLMDVRVLEVEIRLIGVEAVPVVRLGDRIPGPVRALEVLKDDARAAIAVLGVAPHVEIALAAAGRRAAGALEPRVLIGSVVD